MSIPLVEVYVETGSNAGKVHPIDPAKQQIILGRTEPGGQSVDVSFDDVDGTTHDLLVSRQHLQVRVTESGVFATDLVSRNGTTVDGRPLSPQIAQPLRIGARIQLAPPEGPTLIIRERAAASGWGSVDEELHLWQQRHSTLLVDYQQLQRAHTELLDKLRAAGNSPSPASDIDWQRCHAKILDCLERVTVVRQLLMDVPCDTKVHGYLERIRANISEVRSLLKLDVG